MGKLTESEMLKRIAELEGKLAAKNTISMKVSEKGALSIYGLGRFPVTLYAGQMKRLIGIVPAIEKFMKDHDSELVTKD